MRIVVVEDELKILNRISASIPKISPEYAVVGEAKNGVEAIEIITRESPDLVITDIKMPVMNGLDMIRQLKIMKVNCKFIILSGYADFQFAQEAIKLGSADYLLKPITIENLSNSLKTIEESILHENEKNELRPGKYTFKELFHRVAILDDESSNNCIKELKKRIPGSNTLCILLIKTDLSMSIYDKNKVFSAFDKYFSMADKLTYCLCKTNVDNEFVLFSSDSKKSDIISRIEIIKTELIGLMNSVIVFSYKTFNNVEVIHDVIQKIRDNINWSISFKENMLICDELIDGLSCGKFVYPIEIENEVISKIGSFKLEGIKHELDNFVHYLGHCTYHYTDIREALLCMTSAILYAIRKNSYGLYEEINHSEIMDWIKVSLSTREYSNMMMSIVEQYRLHVTNITHCKNPIINRALRIIRNEYNMDISLESISERLKISSEYLSSLFNKELGVKFITFLTQYRVDQAKRLLKGGKLKIYSISQMVGYNDVGYFCKVFKKYTGMSPRDFEHAPE